MSEDHKAAGMTVLLPAPRALPEPAASDGDPRTAEVLRALQRARGTMAKADEPGAAKTSAIAGLQGEVRALREGLTNTMHLTDEIVQRLASSTRALEHSIVLSNEKQADSQRRQEGIARELQEAKQGLRQQIAVVAAWRAWWTKQVAALGIVLVVLLGAGAALLWRMHFLAKDTHDILLQILQNQTKAQTGTGGKR